MCCPNCTPSAWPEVTTVLGFAQLVVSQADRQLRPNEVGSILRDLRTRGFCRSGQFFFRGVEAAPTGVIDFAILQWGQAMDDLSTCGDPVDKWIATVFPTVDSILATIAEKSNFRYFSTKSFGNIVAHLVLRGTHAQNN